jgi:hypothetical protein
MMNASNVKNLRLSHHNQVRLEVNVAVLPRAELSNPVSVGDRRTAGTPQPFPTVTFDQFRRRSAAQASVSTIIPVASIIQMFIALASSSSLCPAQHPFRLAGRLLSVWQSNAEGALKAGNFKHLHTKRLRANVVREDNSGQVRDPQI